jgi:hypothetical protein
VWGKKEVRDGHWGTSPPGPLSYAKGQRRGGARREMA